MTYCGIDCCGQCSRFAQCGGCEKCGGHPFGGSCVAQRNRDFARLKTELITQINALGINGLAVNDLFLLSGEYVNLEYPLDNGTAVKFLTDKNIYLGNQVEKADGRCYGVAADEDFILVGEYGANGAEPKLVLYKHR